MKKIIPDSCEFVQEIINLNYGLILFRCPFNFDIAQISNSQSKHYTGQFENCY